VFGMGKVFVFIAVEIFLLVTPMMWPSIPFEIGLIAYGIAAVFAIIAITMQLRDRLLGVSKYTQVLRANLPEILYSKIHRDGRYYDRARIEIANPPANIFIENVMVKLMSISAVRGEKINVKKYLKFDEEELDAASMATGANRYVVLFESECRQNKSAPKVEKPMLLFGPLRGRSRYVEMPPGRYVATIRIEGSGVKPTDWQFEVQLNRHNRLQMRRARKSPS